MEQIINIYVTVSQVKVPILIFIFCHILIKCQHLYAIFRSFLKEFKQILFKNLSDCCTNL